MSLEADVLKQVEMHLPAMQMEALRSRLNQLDQLEANAAKWKKAAEDNAAAKDKLATELSDVKYNKEEQEKQRRALQEREKKIVDKELEHKIREYQVEAAKDKCNTVVELVRTVFAHKQTISEFTNENRQKPSGTPPYLSGVSESISKHTTVEG